MSKKMGDDAVAKIEAEQSLLMQFIEDSKRLCERSDVLMNEARRTRPSSKESEGETEDA